MNTNIKFNSDMHFYGKPCGNGHEGIRYISNGVCVDCLRMYDRREYLKRYNKERRRSPRLFATNLLHSCKTRSKAKNWEITITADWIREKLEKGVCEVTGLKFDIERSSEIHVAPFAPSIDRIDSSKPYTPENCRVVCMIYNVCKGQWTDEDVLTFAKAVANASGKEQF